MPARVVYIRRKRNGYIPFLPALLNAPQILVAPKLFRAQRGPRRASVVPRFPAPQQLLSARFLAPKLFRAQRGPVRRSSIPVFPAPQQLLSARFPIVRIQTRPQRSARVLSRLPVFPPSVTVAAGVPLLAPVPMAARRRKGRPAAFWPSYFGLAGLSTTYAPPATFQPGPEIAAVLPLDLFGGAGQAVAITADLFGGPEIAAVLPLDLFGGAGQAVAITADLFGGPELSVVLSTDEFGAPGKVAVL